MGYGFIGKHRKTDEESIFYEECMYAYQPVFRECFGTDISEIYEEEIKKLVKQNLLEEDSEWIKLTEQGIDISNYVMSEFIR